MSSFEERLAEAQSDLNRLNHRYIEKGFTPDEVSRLQAFLSSPDLCSRSEVLDQVTGSRSCRPDLVSLKQVEGVLKDSIQAYTSCRGRQDWPLERTLTRIRALRQNEPEGGEGRVMGSTIDEIGHRIRTQDNRITEHPLFLVQRRVRDYGYDPAFTDDTVYLDGEGDEISDPEAAERRLDATRTGYRDRWEFVTACFTEAGAKAYIKANGHNLGETRIFAASLYRNEEMIAVREHLVARSAAPEPEPEDEDAGKHPGDVTKKTPCPECGADLNKLAHDLIEAIENIPIACTEQTDAVMLATYLQSHIERDRYCIRDVTPEPEPLTWEDVKVWDQFYIKNDDLPRIKLTHTTYARKGCSDVREYLGGVTILSIDTQACSRKTNKGQEDADG